MCRMLKPNVVLSRLFKSVYRMRPTDPASGQAPGAIVVLRWKWAAALTLDREIAILEPNAKSGRNGNAGNVSWVMVSFPFE